MNLPDLLVVSCQDLILVLGNQRGKTVLLLCVGTFSPLQVANFECQQAVYNVIEIRCCELCNLTLDISSGRFTKCCDDCSIGLRQPPPPSDELCIQALLLDILTFWIRDQCEISCLKTQLYSHVTD